MLADYHVSQYESIPKMNELKGEIYLVTHYRPGFVTLNLGQRPVALSIGKRH